MNSLPAVGVEGILRWIVDFYLLATLALGLALVAGRWMRQPVRRLTLAWTTLVGLALLAVVCAMPGWPRVSLGWLAPADRTQPAEPQLTEPVATVAEHAALVPPPRDVRPEPKRHGDHPTRNVAARDAGPDNRRADSEPVPTATVSPTNQAAPLRRIPAAIVGLFLAGVCLAVAWLAWGALATMRLCRRATPAPASVAAELTRIVGPARPPRLLLSRRIGSAAALGLLRPTIILPAAVVDDGAAEGADCELSGSLRAVLAHEWAHIRNRDLWLLALGRGLLPLLSAHPLFWWLRKQTRDDQETVADAVAARDNRPDYAAELLDWVRRTSGPAPRRVSAALGIWERPSQLTRRIAMLLDDSFQVQTRATRRWQLGTAAAVAAVGLALSMLTLQAAPPDPIPAAPPAAALAASSEVVAPPEPAPIVELVVLGLPETYVMLNETTARQIAKVLDAPPATAGGKKVAAQPNLYLLYRGQWYSVLGGGGVALARRLLPSPPGVPWYSVLGGGGVALEHPDAADYFEVPALKPIVAGFDEAAKKAGSDEERFKALRAICNGLPGATVESDELPKEEDVLPADKNQVYQPHCVAFSPDGKRLAAGCSYGVDVWNLAARKIEATLKCDQTVLSVAFSPDGATVAAGTKFVDRRPLPDKGPASLMLWDAKSGRELAKKSWDDETLVDVAFTPDGKQLVAGGERLALYSTKSLERQAEIKDVRAPFAVFSDGRQLGARGPGNTLVVVDLATRQAIRRIDTIVQQGRSDYDWWDRRGIAWTTDGKLCACGAGGNVVLYDLATGKELRKLAASARGSVSLVRFSHDGKSLVTTCNKCPMEVWDVEAGKRLKTYDYTAKSIWIFNDVAISPDDKRFAAIPAVYMAEDLNAFGGFIGFWDLGAPK